MCTHDAWPAFQHLIENGHHIPLTADHLPPYADPVQREENYHHVLRYLLETSNWPGLTVYGPETDIGGVNTDLLVDVTTAAEAPVTIDEFIGIEVKTNPHAFEQNTEYLEQLHKQIQTSSLDRLYACTPDTEDQTRLDVDPQGTQIINKLDTVQKGMALRGVSGTVQLPDGNEVPKLAYYRKLLSQDKEQFIEAAKRQGDWETICENIERNDSASLSRPQGSQSNNWVYKSLKEVGILRIDPQTSDLTTQTGAGNLDRSSTPSQVSQDQPEESDIVHALWVEYNTRSNTEAAVEINLPSITSHNEHTDLFGQQTIIRSPRIDIFAADGERHIGIEAKGPEYDSYRLFNDQLPKYLRATELDYLFVATPASERQRTLNRLADEYPNVGLLIVDTTQSDPTIQRIRDPKPLSQ